MNTNLLRVLILEPLQLLFCLLIVEACILKLRLKLSVLGLQRLYLRFRVRQTVERKRKTFPDDVRHRDFFECVSGKINQAHTGDVGMTANDPKLSDGGAWRGSCVVERSGDIRARVKGGSGETGPS